MEVGLLNEVVRGEIRRRTELCSYPIETTSYAYSARAGIKNTDALGKFGRVK